MADIKACSSPVVQHGKDQSSYGIKGVSKNQAAESPQVAIAADPRKSPVDPKTLSNG